MMRTKRERMFSTMWKNNVYYPIFSLVIFSIMCYCICRRIVLKRCCKNTTGEIGMFNYNLKSSVTNDPRTELALAKKHYKELGDKIKEQENKIRKGEFSEFFDLIEPAVTMFVQKEKWEEALGEDWIKANQEPQKKRKVIVPKK